jgi:hypothetical protein
MVYPKPIGYLPREGLEDNIGEVMLKSSAEGEGEDEEE